MKTLFASDKIKVYKNNSNEIFHLNKITGVCLRINNNSKETTITYNLDTTKLDKIKGKYCKAISSPTDIRGMNAFKFERIDFN